MEKIAIFFPKKGRGGSGAVRKFSGNSSVFVCTGFPYSQPPGRACPPPESHSLRGLLNIKTPLFPEYPFDLPSRLGKVGTHCLRGVHLTLTLPTEIMRGPLGAPPRLRQLQLYILCQLPREEEQDLFVTVNEFSRLKMIGVLPAILLGSPSVLCATSKRQPAHCTINKSIIHQQPITQAGSPPA